MLKTCYSFMFLLYSVAAAMAFQLMEDRLRIDFSYSERPQL